MPLNTNRPKFRAISQRGNEGWVRCEEQGGTHQDWLDTINKGDAEVIRRAYYSASPEGGQPFTRYFINNIKIRQKVVIEIFGDHEPLPMSVSKNDEDVCRKREAPERKQVNDEMDQEMGMEMGMGMDVDLQVPSTPETRQVRARFSTPTNANSAVGSSSGGSSSVPSSYYGQRQSPAQASGSNTPMTTPSSLNSFASPSLFGGQSFGGSRSGFGPSASSSSPQQDQAMNDIAGPSSSVAGPSASRAEASQPSSDPTKRFSRPQPNAPRRRQRKTDQTAIREVNFTSMAPSAPASEWGGSQVGQSNYASSIADSVGSVGTVTQSVYNADQARAGQISGRVTGLLIDNPNHMDTSK